MFWDSITKTQLCWDKTHVLCLIIDLYGVYLDIVSKFYLKFLVLFHFALKKIFDISLISKKFFFPLQKPK